jgi:osmotically inducible lipoprotein OsmB
MRFLSLSVAVVFVLAAIVLSVALAGCTTTQQTVGGATAGGITGALIAGPIGAAVGAGGGAVVASVAGSRG